MLPFLSSGSQIGIAMTALYGLLGITSLLVQRLAAPTGSLRNQVNAWWRIFPVVTIALLLYPLGPWLLAGLICLLAVRELAPYADEASSHFRRNAALVVSAATALQLLVPAVFPVVLPALIVAQFLFFRARPVKPSLVYLLLWLTIAAAWSIVRFIDIPAGPAASLAWLFYLFIVTALNDIGQFIGGKLFGSHKIAPTISPNKTWQGLAGGVAVSQLLTLVLGSYLQLGSPARMAAYALLLSVGGFAGDLMFSAAKRYLGIKDFSQLIPGHGGILDRIDSLVVTAPLLYILVITMEGTTS
ncbi:phosphatidate cytidylyltransferase [Pseudoduganella sp. SL102]|uniref:phosphatidate cytidylyltransferase n=1 Tax=Pseudoduganella sp. SL102 TaxID=2995154 RepID=UPI00248BDB95|nr:phosphatidate cytidylyltransferase [Pseudoduganella sp. SL102]WBS02719.1 phosphatidate cytidylyltransferase [Pseudoduganella sp. SL102]